MAEFGAKPRDEEPFDLHVLTKSQIPIAAADDNRFDAVGPFIRPPRGVRCPWIAYIPDVQHRRLPDMFSPEERRERDRDFSALLSGAAAVLVNSADVANDLRRFYPAARGELISLPFAACAEPGWFDGEEDIRTRYGIDGRFFLCSNQFWKHKNHRVVLAAIALARQEGDPVRFVFTGATHDYRHPDYFAGLLDEIRGTGIGEDIHVLGFIPKLDQIRLMQAADAVVQPSLFEGGPGGGSIYNAIALGRPVIVSDLPVNREIEALVTYFFDPYDPADLLKKLRLIEATDFHRQSPTDLLRDGDERRRAFGLALHRAFASACGS